MNDASKPAPTLKEMVDALLKKRQEHEQYIANIDRQLEEAGISTKPKRTRKTRSDAGQPKAGKA